MTIKPEFVVEHGVPFNQAFKVSENDYQSKDQPWASFGAYDEKQVLATGTVNALVLGAGYHLISLFNTVVTKLVLFRW